MPLALHGDGVPISGLGKSRVQTVTNWSWYSLVTSCVSTADSLIFVYAMCDKMRQHGETLDGTAHHFLMLLRWSFQCLFKGTWPTHDYLGNAPFGLVGF